MRAEPMRGTEAWGTGPAATAMDFEIAALDAYHLVVGDRAYWKDFRSSNSVETDRFLLKPGWRTVYTRCVETALVKVTLADGTIGWGEATEQICPEVICHLAASLLGPVLGSRTWRSPSELWEAAYDLNRGRGHHSGYHLLAAAALDVAVWDALARRAAQPLARLLSDAPAPALDLYVSGLRRGSPQERIELLRERVADGFAGAKIFVDADTEATLTELSGLRRGVAGDWKLMVDALWSYDSVAAAAEARRRFGDLGVNWLECPLVPEDFDAHRELARAEGAPVALGEHFFTHHQSAPWFRAGLLEVFQPDICRTGFSNGMVQANLARAAGIRPTPHMGSGSPIVQAVALSFGAACRAEEPCEYQIDLAGLLPDVFHSAWIPDRGRMPLCEEPGLGVSVDEQALERHTAETCRWRVHDLADKSGLS